jgi:hypothetical protein
MRRYFVLVSTLALLALIGATTASAQVTASDSVPVSARNIGLFTFTINEASFDFGDVGSSGTLLGATAPGVVGNGRNGADDGGSYTAASAVTWNCSSAPSRTVAIYNDSSAVAGALPGDRLEIQIPAAGGGASQGYKRFSTDSGTPAGDLVTGMTVGNGGNSVNGTVDFRLSVLDADATGSTTWTVVLTASGT